MRKLFALIVIFLSGLSAAQTTPNLGLNIPVFGSPRWDVKLNANFTSLDSYLSGGSVIPGPGIQIGGAFKLGGVVFASLPASGTFAQNGAYVFCVDCQQQTPCVGSGTGAFAQRIAGAWSCSSGTGTPANAIINNPIADQPITQPFTAGNPTSFTPDTLNRIFYVTPNMNWSATPVSPSSLTGGSPATITLTTCPKGLEAASGNDFLLIGTTGTEETPVITATTCSTGGGGSGTVTVTPVFSHSAGYSVGSATAGAQETLNAAAFSNNVFPNNNASVIFPATGGNTPPTWKAPLWIPAERFTIDFSGYVAICAPKNGRTCINNTKRVTRIIGLTVKPGIASNAVLITSTSLTSNAVTLHTATDPTGQGIGVGSYLCVYKTDQQGYWGCGQVVTGVTSSTVTYALTATNLTSVTTPGAVMLENSVIETSGSDVRIENTQFLENPASYFNNGMLVLGGANVLIDGAKINVSTQPFNSSSVYTAPVIMVTGPQSSSPLSLNLIHLDLPLNCKSDGILYYGGNQVTVRDSYIDAPAEYVARFQDFRGGFQKVTWDEVTNFVGSCAVAGGNPTGNVGQTGISAAGPSPASGYPSLRADITPQAYAPKFVSSGATQYAYWLVVHEPDYGVSNPIFFGWAADSTADTVALSWPRVRGFNSSSNAVAAVTYDLLRTTFTTLASPPSGTGNFAVATGVAQCAGFVCTANDTNAALSSYTVAAVSYYPALDHWPGTLILSADSNTTTFSPSVAELNYYNGSSFSAPVITVYGSKVPTLISTYCAVNGGFLSNISSIQEQCNNFPFRESGSTALSTGLATVNLKVTYLSAPAGQCNNTNQSGSPIACSIFCNTSSCTIKSGAGSDTVTYQVEGTY